VRPSFVASLPERLVRSVVGGVAGLVHESAQVVLPRFVRRSRLYEASAKNLLRILIEGVGDVEPLTPTTPDPNAPAPKQLAIRKGVGNIVELGSIAAFGFSPLWLLAAAADLTHGSRVYLHALTDDLKASGVIRDDVDVSSVDDLLGILEGTSGRTARLIDIPPVELAELRVSLRELADGATDLPSQEQLGRLYESLRRTAAAEDRSLLEISQGVGMAFVTSARTISDRHVQVPYREDWEPLRDEGFAAYARRVSRPYGEAAASHFDPDRRSYTERVLNRIPEAPDPESFEFCDELEQGFGWIAKEKLARCSHALESRGEVWIFDPVLWPPAIERIAELADILGLVTFALPALLLLSQWVPGRTAQIRKQKEAAVVLTDGPSPERRRLLAMRAAFSLPYGHLLRYTKDPIGDLEGGRYDALVAAALEDAGLRSS
jgi:hypothetical protein